MKNNEFIRGKVPITKEEVRAISLNKLNLVFPALLGLAAIVVTSNHG